MQGTPNWNIQYLEPSDNASLEAASAAQASSIEDALDELGGRNALNSYDWADLAARTAQTGMEQGDHGFQRDNKHTYRYNGATWEDWTPALIPVVPSSVAGAGVTLDPRGRVTFTSATSLSVNGVFDGLGMDIYLIQVSLEHAASGTISIRMRASGSDTTSGYTYVNETSTLSTGPTRSANASASSFGFIRSTSAGTSGSSVMSMDVYGPKAGAGSFVALHTEGLLIANGDRFKYSEVGSVTRPGGGFDGFSFLISASNVSGSLAVYKYTNND